MPSCMGCQSLVVGLVPSAQWCQALCQGEATSAEMPLKTDMLGTTGYCLVLLGSAWYCRPMPGLKLGISCVVTFVFLRSLESFCVSADHIFLLGSGPHPNLSGAEWAWLAWHRWLTWRCPVVQAETSIENSERLSLEPCVFPGRLGCAMMCLTGNPQGCMDFSFNSFQLCCARMVSRCKFM